MTVDGDILCNGLDFIIQCREEMTLVCYTEDLLFKEFLNTIL